MEGIYIAPFFRVNGCFLVSGSIGSNCQSFGGLDDWTLPTGGPPVTPPLMPWCFSKKWRCLVVSKMFDSYTILQLFVRKRLSKGLSYFTRIFLWLQMHPHRMISRLLKTGPRC